MDEKEKIAFSSDEEGKTNNARKRNARAPPKQPPNKQQQTTQFGNKILGDPRLQLS